MRIGYFDCFSGASGDMILGALIGAGVPADVLRAQLGHLGVGGYELRTSIVKRHGLAALKVDVEVAEQTGHRHLRDIAAIIEASSLGPAVKDRATRIFTRLAHAEAKVHATSVEKVHFHEVGAVDAIVDVVGAVIGIEHLRLGRVVCSPIPPGSGTVHCSHGRMPIPAPATAELLCGVPLAACDEPGELTTPTGAAILTTLAESYGPLPAMRMTGCGVGAGTREGRTRPNILRLIVGEAAGEPAETDEIVVLEANLDDATGEEIGFVVEELFAAGALDVFTMPIYMKKGRPGVLLSVLSPTERAAACEEVILTRSGSFGVRRSTRARRKLARTIEDVMTRFGRIRVKVGRLGGRVVVASPEYEDCATAARTHAVPLRDVMTETRRAWHEKCPADQG